MAHKGGVGQAPCHSPRSKGETVRALVNGFGIRNPSDVDLILRRKSHPEPGSMAGFAGALPRGRGRDLPEAIRQTSIEHSVQRRHCSPSPDRQTTGNMVMRLASCHRDARDCGRGIKGSPRRQFRSLSPPSRSRVTSPRNRVRRSCSQAALPDPVFAAELPCEIENTCSWGDDVDPCLRRNSQSHRFHWLAFEPIQPTSPLIEVQPLQPLQTMENLEKEWRSPSSNASTRRPSRCPTLSNFTDQSVLFEDWSRQLSSNNSSTSKTNSSAEVPAADNAETLTSFTKAASKREARAYERQLQAMVKDAQKKALKKAA